MFPFSYSNAKATEKSCQEESSVIIDKNLRRLQKIITDSTGLVKLPDFKYSQVVQSSEGPLLQTLLEPPPYRGLGDKLKSMFKPDRPITHGQLGVSQMSSAAPDGIQTNTMLIISKQDKHGNVSGKSDMGSLPQRNKIDNYIDKNSSAKHKVIFCYNKGASVYQSAHKNCPCYTDPLYNTQRQPGSNYVKKKVNGRFKWVRISMTSSTQSALPGSGDFSQSSMPGTGSSMSVNNDNFTFQKSRTIFCHVKGCLVDRKWHQTIQCNCQYRVR